MLRRPASLVLILISCWLVVSAAAADRPDIVLVTLDSVRADRMHFLGSNTKLTPNLDGLANQGIVFPKAYAQAPSTVVSHATILTGLYPQAHHVSEFASPLPGETPYLPDLLRAHGYRTAAFVGSVLLDPKNGFAPGFDRGFDVYDAGFVQIKSAPNQSFERRGDQVVARATEWLNAHATQPFFLWVHIFDAHAPYATTYDRGVTSADAAVGKLLTALRINKVWENSILIAVADHGESLGAHSEATHGVFLYDETIHVPLLLKLPENKLAGKQVKGRVRLIDVAPTVLEAAGIPVPSSMQGQSLLRMAKNNSEADQPAYARSDFPQQAFGWSPLESWRSGKYLYVRAPRPELYDLAADPEAARNLASSSPAILSTLAGQLEAFDNHFNSKQAAAATAGLSSSEVQKLASLGYVGVEKSSSHANVSSSGVDPKDKVAIANEVLSAMASATEGKSQKAMTALTRMVKENPDAYLAQYGLGTVLAHEQQYVKAVEHLHKAIDLLPDSAWAHYQMGETLIKTGDYKTAIVHLEIAATRLPECKNAHLLLAQSYEHVGRMKDAESARKKASN